MVSSRTTIGLGMIAIGGVTTLYEHQFLIGILHGNMYVLVPALAISAFISSMHSREIDRFMHPDAYEEE